MITSRDIQVVEFLDRFKIAKTSTIAALFYPSLLVAQKRLKVMYEDKQAKRARDNITSEYFYYINKPKQLRHSLLLTDFYREFNKVVEIVDFKNEVTIDKLRADGLVAYKKNGKGYIAFVEVQISNTPLDLKKYQVLLKSEEYKRYFPVFPKIIAVTNKNIPGSELDIIQIREDLSNIRGIFNEKNYDRISSCIAI